jgi:acyl carrier protein
MEPLIVTKDALHQQMLDLFADIFQVDMQPGMTDIRRDDVREWDSVNHLRLVMELEEQYGITLSDADVLNINSLQEAENILLRIANTNDSPA